MDVDHHRCPRLPRYFLNQRQGERYLPDEEGSEHETLDQVRAEAIDAAREIMAERVRHGRQANHSQFEITDSAGAIVLIVPFSEALGRD